MARKKAVRKTARRKAFKTLKASAKIKRAAKRSAVRAAKGARLKYAIRARKQAARPFDRLVLYGLHLSLPSCKVGLMLSLCGANFDYKHVDLMAGENKRPEFLAKNRFGQVPVLQDGATFLCQSNVILQFLAEKYGKFAGRTPAERMRVAEWLAWDLDHMASGLGFARAAMRFWRQEPPVMDFFRARGEQALATLDRQLGVSKFIAGPQPTIADIAIFPWVATADEGGFDVARYPNVRDWAERMLKLPGAAHPYAIMPKEDRVAA